MIDIPTSIASERLIIRMPTVEDAPEVRDAIAESIDALRPWMDWADEAPALEEVHQTLARATRNFENREDLWLFLFRKEDDQFVGGSGLHDINWDVPRFEIGYWVRTRFAGQGYITEAVRAITDFAFDTLQARRVEIRMSARNEKSWRVAERAGYTLEGILYHDSRERDGRLRDTKVYAQTRPDPPSRI